MATKAAAAYETVAGAATAATPVAAVLTLAACPSNMSMVAPFGAASNLLLDWLFWLSGSINDAVNSIVSPACILLGKFVSTAESYYLIAANYFYSMFISITNRYEYR